jgi:23S rRNA (uracil1939-C5)-methyltransferase
MGFHDIFIVTSRHVETVVSFSHKNADSYIHINVEFGEGDGRIPVEDIVRKAELI